MFGKNNTVLTFLELSIDDILPNAKLVCVIVKRKINQQLFLINKKNNT